ncbi:MAG: PorP/SprF family type IX secretion system membrane protein [Bacteroidota bacterium]
MRVFLSVIFTVIVFSASCQEGQFSQYFSTSALLNPAFTGALPNITLNSNFSRAGNPFSEEYLELMQTTFTYPFRKFTSRFNQVGGAGVTFFKETRGYRSLYSNTKVLLSGAYTMKLSKLSNQYLIFGLQGGMVLQSIDANKLRWGSQFTRYFANPGNPVDAGYDGSKPGEFDVNGIGDPRQYSNYPIFNFGVIYTVFDNANFYIRDKTLTVGLSIDNLNRPNVSYLQGPDIRKFWLIKAFGSAKMELGPRWFIYPSAYIAYSQGSLQANAGTYFSTFVSSVRSNTAVMLQLGSWYRIGDSFIGMFGFQVENIRMGFSLGMNDQTFELVRAKGSKLPTYEVSLTYNLSLKSPMGNVSSPIF